MNNNRRKGGNRKIGSNSFRTNRNEHQIDNGSKESKELAHDEEDTSSYSTTGEAIA